MVRQVILVLLLLAALYVAQHMFSTPVYSYEIRSFGAPVEAFLPAGSKAYISFSNGSLALIDFNAGSTISRVIKPIGLDVVGMFYNASTLVIVDSSGTVIVINSSTLEPLYSLSAIAKSDEVYVSRASLSQDGRFLALDIVYTVKSAKLDRLVVIDLSRRNRVFERDVNSNDVLCKIFSLDFYQRYLVVETIDTLCELCQLTDNKIEVYSVTASGVVKVASLQTGLTTKAVGAGYVVAQRVKDDGGQHETFVLSLPDLRILADRGMQPIAQIVPLGSNFVVVFWDGTTSLCDASLRCTNFFSIPTKRSVRVFSQNLIAIFTVSDVLLYATDYRNPPVLIGRYQIDWPSLSWDPVESRNSEQLFIAKYGNNYLVFLYPLARSTVYIRVVDRDGAQISDANVNIVSGGSSYSTLTNSTGWAKLIVPPGNYTVEVLKQGYSENKFSLTVNQPTIVFETRMDRERPKRFLLVVRVVGERGEPIPGARVSISGSEAYELTTPASGEVSIDLLKGNYSLRVQAPLYISQSLNFSLEQNRNLTVTLKRETFNLTLLSPRETSLKVKISRIDSPSSPVVVGVEQGLVKTVKLEAGSYQMSIVETPGNYTCRLNASTIVWRTGLDNLVVRVECSLIKTGEEAHLAEILARIGNETLVSRRVSKSVSLGSITLYNGQQLDLAEASWNKILVIELFYTQCTGCKYLIPLLKRLSERNDTVVVSITVSQTDTPDILKRYSLDNNITWPIGYDDVRIASQVNATSFPTVLVIKDGSLVLVGIGAKKELEEAQNKYASLLNSTGLPSILTAGRVVAPETLIITGLFLLVLSIIAGGGNAGEKRQEKEAGLSPYTGNIRPLSSSLRSDNTQALRLADEVLGETTF
ncbi:carboxypeptidase regulatory-like domain-containing protein [Infirmifilum lucidum]|uniref:Carboxypeptidase regulatory-like domain-containing protein n=1 Tax=Infirmifilum lucidum TaxID=2776706 RepID=A0A7L9FL56_9CREN|nr:carboxypeptidase regulatory-like domain-containing protein [Infirmifilum lucidum]QOJ79565.1 carboxypeptidase regulatory-like domain-containing protein [Infirmifilum lucidum]